jgi:hypothetical protein
MKMHILMNSEERKQDTLQKNEISKYQHTTEIALWLLKTSPAKPIKAIASEIAP